MKLNSSHLQGDDSLVEKITNIQVTKIKVVSGKCGGGVGWGWVEGTQHSLGTQRKNRFPTSAIWEGSAPNGSLNVGLRGRVNF